MKEFNEAAAKRGARVCTRDGWPVRIFSYNLQGHHTFPILASYVDGSGFEYVDRYTVKGESRIGNALPQDLMMADDDYEEKLGRGEYDTPSGGSDSAPVPDPWEAFKREAAMELLRKFDKNAVCDLLPDYIIKLTNRLVEGPQGRSYKNESTDLPQAVKMTSSLKDGQTSQLNPLFVQEMMGFPYQWTELPFQSGEQNPSKPTETR